MSDATDPAGEPRGSLDIVRMIEAPLERVWDAWTTEAGLASWWWSHWAGVTFDVDARVGGEYRIAAPEQGIVVSGTYLTVDAPERLSFTWLWTDDEGALPGEEVDVRFRRAGEATRIALSHTGPWPDSGPAESYRQGWEFVLDALAAVVAREAAGGARP
jgi:uncharacterized protein YndB with AHSA1/START domain